MILAINCGSSSLKYTLFDMENYKTISTGLLEKIGNEAESTITHKVNGEKTKVVFPFPNHEVGLKKILEFLKQDGINEKDIDLVAHRFVHGGEKYKSSQIVTKEDLIELAKLNDLAPLHNPANINGIECVMEVMPWATNTITLDTSFHETLPSYVYTYAVPAEWKEKYNVRKFGFHGTSYLYTSRRLAHMIGKNPQDVNCIICHIGSGASVSLIKGGCSADTSLGFSPLEGVVMGTRPGDLDVGIIPYLERQGISLKDQEHAFSKKCGLLGICGFNDMRDIEERYTLDEKCALAFDVMCYRIAKYIASYYGILSNCDGIVFTAGGGENSPFMRETIARILSALDIRIDEEKNKVRGEEIKITTDASKVPVFVIPTNEEIVLIEDAFALKNGIYKSPKNFYHYRFQD